MLNQMNFSKKNSEKQKKKNSHNLSAPVCLQTEIVPPKAFYFILVMSFPSVPLNFLHFFKGKSNEQE